MVYLNGIFKEIKKEIKMFERFDSFIYLLLTLFLLLFIWYNLKLLPQDIFMNSINLIFNIILSLFIILQIYFMEK